MSDDTKTTAIVVLGVVLVIAGCIFGGIQCNKQDNATLTECIKQGRPPMECRAAVVRYQ